MSPGFKSILTPLGLPIGLTYIGQGSPPRFIVVEISQENLSVCLASSSPRS